MAVTDSGAPALVTATEIPAAQTEPTSRAEHRFASQAAAPTSTAMIAVAATRAAVTVDHESCRTCGR
jgi:DNA integrity scanning protein DisA with diadenylate cyclase activity